MLAHLHRDWIQLHMQRLTCQLGAKVAASLLQAAVIQLAPQPSPGILRLPDEHACVWLPHVGSPALQQCPGSSMGSSLEIQPGASMQQE